MFRKENFGKSIRYFDTSLIALILSIVMIPVLWHISKGDSFWILSCSIIWWIGSFVIFHPSIRFLFPFLLTKISAFALTFILSIITILVNSTILSMLIPVEDIDTVINSTLFSTSIGTVALFILLYIIIAGTTVANLNINYILYRQKEFIQQIFTLSEYYIEVLFLFVIPVILLFWTDITYSFRTLLGLISIGVGMSILIPKIKIEHRILLSTLSIIAVFLINGAVENLINMNSTPITNTIQANNEEKQLFQLSENVDGVTVYQILLSIPQIGIYLGHKVATIPKREISIEVSKSQYTIHDQYNDRVLSTLDR